MLRRYILRRMVRVEADGRPRKGRVCAPVRVAITVCSGEGFRGLYITAKVGTRTF